MPNLRFHFDLRFICALVGLTVWLLAHLGVEVPSEVREYLLIILVTLLGAPVRRSVAYKSHGAGTRFRPRLHLRRKGRS
jgi:uncharacterized membrane protein YbjE (DUF340 family)